MAAPLTINRDLVLEGSLTIASGDGTGPVTLAAQPGGINSVVANGQILSVHDALYRFADNMTSNGTGIDMDGNANTGFPRWGLADAATQRVKGVFEIPAEWDTVAFRFYWCKESASAATVNFDFTYHLYYPFAAEDLDVGTVTTVDLGALAGSGTAFRGVYEIPASLAAIATADGFISSKPFMSWSIERDGVADAYNGVASIAAATLTRTS